MKLFLYFNTKVFIVYFFVFLTGCNTVRVEKESKSNSENTGYTFATYNVRYKNGVDDKVGHSWSERSSQVLKVILKYEFDIFGVQEPFKSQIYDLSKGLVGYENFGVSDDNVLNSSSSHHHDIFYKSSKFNLVEQGVFWLSPNAPKSPPKDLMKAAWGGKAKVCVWGKFRDKQSKDIFYVFNTHFFYDNELTRINSSKIILEKVKEIAGNSPVVFMGDLNFDPNSKAYDILQSSTLLEDSYIMAKERKPSNKFARYQTFNRWLIKPDKSMEDGRIDYIFLSKHWKNKVKSNHVLWDSYVNKEIEKMPSDHNPVMIKLEQLNL